MKYCYLFLVILFAISTEAQQPSSKNEIPAQSWLNTLEDEELLTQFDEFRGDTIAQEKIARTYLTRARREGDTIKMARGFSRLANIFDHKENLRFSDSIISLTQNHSNITFPGLAYIIKAYHAKNDAELINNLLTCYYYAVKEENYYQRFHVLSMFFTLKNNWGDPIEAYGFLKKNEKILKRRDIKYQIKRAMREDLKTDSVVAETFNLLKVYNLIDHIEIYLALKKYDSSLYFINRARVLNTKTPTYINDDFSTQIDLFEIQRNLALKNFTQLKNNLIVFKRKENLRPKTKFELNFYEGMGAFGNGDIDLGMNRLLLAEQKLNQSWMNPRFRKMYDTLLKYSHRTALFNDKDLLQKALKMDSVLLEGYKMVNPSIIKYIETPSLIAEKEKLISSLKKQNAKPNKTIWILISLLSVSLIILWYYKQRQKLYRKRFLQLQKRLDAPTRVRNLQDRSTKNDLSPEVIETILGQLDRFEQSKQFTNPNVSLRFLAKKFNTNTNYLSRVINLKMGKNFSQYLNELRVEFVLKELNENPLVRKYAIKALAEECGYTNAVSFSRAFYAKTGIKPSYYIENLERSTA